MPFEDSRRLTGANRFFATTGAVLEVPGQPIDPKRLSLWKGRVQRAADRLSWPTCQPVARVHACGTSLALSAPCDQLFLATEVNEWALTGAVEESAAFAHFKQLSGTEGRPGLSALIGACAERHLAVVVDEDDVLLGLGAGGRQYSLSALPNPVELNWNEIQNIPVALVTGSNGKTTTARLLAACARAHGWRTGLSCTDGVFIDGVAPEFGDYSGPEGARRVVKNRVVQAAVLETARGGILRRGIAVTRVPVAIVTNVSGDHFGEYGIDDLAALAAAKLSVAGVIGEQGLLVLNADDPELRAQAEGLAQRFGTCPPLGWFAVDADAMQMVEYRAAGSPSCGARDGRLILSRDGLEHDLGAINSMPLSAGGVAVYNIANLAGAALVASALAIPVTTIAEVFRHFGASPEDNPGRLMRFEIDAVQVLLDYAHNPEGLHGLLTVAQHLSQRSGGRLGLLLGHAGNRHNADIERLARTAAEFRPDLVVVKEIETHLRGRLPGEVPQVIHAQLLRSGLAESAVRVKGSEVEAAQCALEWARPGDVLALLIHSASARDSVLSMLATARLSTGRL